MITRPQRWRLSVSKVLRPCFRAVTRAAAACPAVNLARRLSSKAFSVTFFNAMTHLIGKMLAGSMAVLLLGNLVSCTQMEAPASRVWKVSVNAGPASETRAVSVGGNDGKTLYTNWDQGDLVRVVKSDGTALEQLSADVSAGNTAYATLTGTLTGTFSVGDVLSLYYHEASLDYTGQNGTVNCVSASYSFMEASSSVKEVDAQGGFLKMSDAAFTHRQAFFQLRFVDKDNNPLLLERLSIYADGGKVVLTRLLGSDASYATEVLPLTIAPASATGQLFFALRDENGASNTYHFKAVIGSEEYSIERDLNPISGHFYIGTVQISGAGTGGDSLNEVFFTIADYSSGGTLNW